MILALTLLCIFHFPLWLKDVFMSQGNIVLSWELQCLLIVVQLDNVYAGLILSLWFLLLELPGAPGWSPW